MVEALLDTSVIIDLLRGYDPAREWFGEVGETLGVTKFIWLETIEGATSNKRQSEAVELLNSFSLVAISEQDIDWAIETLLLKVPMFNGLDMADALIASTSARLNIPLYNRNLKHFTPLIGDLAVQPYT